MKILKIVIVIGLMVMSVTSIFAQNWLEGAGQKWDDDIKEWTIYTDSLEGELKFRWKLANSGETWDYRFSDVLNGKISQVWADKRTEWELRSTDGEVITMRTIWNNDLSEWRITNNDQTVKLKQKWNNDINEWYVKSSETGNMVIHTEWENDFRDWKVVDDMTDEVSVHFRMAVLFIVMIMGF